MTISTNLDFGEHIADATTDAGVTIPNVFEESIFEFEFETTDQIFRVRQHHLDNPDVIADLTLGEPGFWWIILVANGIFHPRELEVGMELQIPEIAEVFDFIEEHRR